MSERTTDSMAAMLNRCNGCASVDRRTFLAQTAITGVVAFLAGCAAGGGTTGPSFTGPLKVSVADFPALATVGGIARVDGGHGSPVAAVRVSATQFNAFSLECPHQGATVNISSSGFKCPQHGAQFAADGTWVGGQSTSNLHAFAAEFDQATDELTITA